MKQKVPQGRKAQIASEAQPLEALQVDGAQLKMATVVAVSGRSESSIRRAIATGELAQPVRHSRRCARFRSEDVRAWLSSGVA